MFCPFAGKNLRVCREKLDKNKERKLVCEEKQTKPKIQNQGIEMRESNKGGEQRKEVVTTEENLKWKKGEEGRKGVREKEMQIIINNNLFRRGNVHCWKNNKSEVFECGLREKKERKEKRKEFCGEEIGII
jgi:hypothetical protein